MGGRQSHQDGKQADGRPGAGAARPQPEKTGGKPAPQEQPKRPQPPQ
ncbi:MAG: hypothetical protein AB7T59_15310 [Hyphomonadaceae bacterium]